MDTMRVPGAYGRGPRSGAVRRPEVLGLVRLVGGRDHDGVRLRQGLRPVCHVDRESRRPCGRVPAQGAGDHLVERLAGGGGGHGRRSGGSAEFQGHHPVPDQHRDPVPPGVCEDGGGLTHGSAHGGLLSARSSLSAVIPRASCLVPRSSFSRSPAFLTLRPRC